MPPQRRRIVPGSTPKRRQRYVAGTRPRADEPPRKSPASDPAVGVEGEEKQVEGTAEESKAPAVSESSAPESSAPDTAEAQEPGAPVEVQKLPPPKASDAVSVPSEVPASGGLPPESGSTAVDSGNAAWRTVAIVGAVAVALGAFAAVAAWKPGADVDNLAWVDQGLTSEVTAAATEAIETLSSYNHESIDEDFDRIRSVLNEEKLAEFEQTAETTKSAAIQTRTATEAMVTDIGVSWLEPDRAEVLAHLNVSATGDGIAQGSVAGPILVRLEKTDGEWLLSYISDNAG